MKKKVLAGLLMSVMVLASVMSVSAATSKTETKETAGASVGQYQFTTGEDEFAKKDNEDAAKHEAAIKIVKEINDGKTVSITTEVDKEIEGKKLVEKFFDFDEVKDSDHKKCHDQGSSVRGRLGEDHQGRHRGFDEGSGPLQSYLDDGRLRRPWFLRSDSSAGRYAWSDG